MKIVGFIPYWLKYHNIHSHVDSGEMKKIGGRYIINYSIELMNNSKYINDTIVFSSSPDVLEYVDNDLQYSYWKRHEYLDNNDVTIDEIISEFLKNTDADVFVLLHPNSPFLSTNSMDDCIEKVVSGEYDSSFTAYEFKKFAWYGGTTLNYSLDKPTPKLSDVEPVYIEQSSLYVFTRKVFEKRNKRIGDNPYLCSINHFEGHEINSHEDYDIAELIVNAGLYNGD